MSSEKRLKRKRGNPISDVFQDDKSFTLPRDQINEAFSHFTTDLDIQTVTGYKLDTLFSGGIQFSRTGYELDSEKHKAMGQKIKTFVKTAWKYLWCISLVAIIVDVQAALDDPFPFLILPLEILETEYYKDPLGRRQFHYYRPCLTAADKIEIPNVTTFFLHNECIDQYGNLASTVICLMPEVEDLYWKRLNTRIADYNRANPALITEEAPDKTSSNELTVLPNLFDKLKPDATTDLTGISGFTRNGIPSGKDVTRLGEKEQRRIDLENPYKYRLDLESRRKIAVPQQSEVPTDLLAVAAQKKENVFHAFGVPLSMISNASSSSTMKQASGKAGPQKGGGQNSSAKQLFYSQLAEMKNFTVGMIEKLLNDFYMREHVEQVKKDEPEKKHKPQELAAKATVKVSIPAYPDNETIERLFIQGVIKYSYYKDATAQQYSIPLEAFNEKPELSTLELNGMQEQLPPASGSSK